MGYDLHITRKEYWSDDEENTNNISLSEWLKYINKDQELELSDAYKVKIPESHIESTVAPGFCNWINHPQNIRPWFEYYEGNIITKNPDKDTIRKMLNIANALQAKLQGDDGEVYKISTLNKIIHHDEFENNNTTDTTSKNPWWKFW